MAKRKINIEEIRELVSERVFSDILSPGVHMSHGERAQIAGKLEAIAKYIQDDIKADLEGLSERYISNDVVFEGRKGSIQTRVDTDAVKRTYPSGVFPDLYYGAVVKPTIAISLPFDKKLDLK